MKKEILVFLCLLTLQLTAQQNQNLFNVGLKEGATTSQVSGDTYGGFDKFGFVGGGFLKGNLDKKWTPGFEIIYIQKGSRHWRDIEKGDITSYFLQIDYVEIPMLMQYNLDLDQISGVSLQMGPSIGFVVRSKEVIEEYGVDFGPGPAFSKYDFSVNFGVNYRFSSHFGVNFRYTNSVAPIRKPLNPSPSGINYGQLHTVLAMALTYDYTAKKKKKF